MAKVAEFEGYCVAHGVSETQALEIRTGDASLDRDPVRFGFARSSQEEDRLPSGKWIQRQTQKACIKS